MSETPPEFDVVAIARAYVGVNDVGDALIKALAPFYREKKIPPVELITAVGRLMLSVMTQNHVRVEDYFAHMTHEQGRMIQTHNKMKPHCDAFRRFH